MSTSPWTLGVPTHCSQRIQSFRSVPPYLHQRPKWGRWVQLAWSYLAWNGASLLRDVNAESCHKPVRPCYHLGFHSDTDVSGGRAAVERERYTAQNLGLPALLVSKS